jgi:hypothetical protein
LGNTAFGNKVRKLKPGHGSFWNFTKIIKNKFLAIPALKIDGLTLITESEKANAIASNFSLAHENSLHSDQSASVQDRSSALYSDAFNDDSSSYTLLERSRMERHRVAMVFLIYYSKEHSTQGTSD